MLFLSEKEKKQWTEYASSIFGENLLPDFFKGAVRENLKSAFNFYAGAYLAARGKNRQAIEWLRAGALNEEEGLFSSTFLLGFLERHNGELIMPSLPFEDPKRFIHFAGVPAMKKARENFIQQAGHTLPRFTKPVSFMDIGCGDGSLTVRLLSHLLATGRIDELREILLVDSSDAMITLAKKNIVESFPDTLVRTENCRVQDFSCRIDHRFDIAMSSLAYHHMPAEDKKTSISQLKPWINHFLLFELDANNDLPELFSPELALSVYQSYGRVIDFVYAHDAPVDVVTDCVDSFLMTELVSMMTQARGVRTDYHMLRSQWNDLFHSKLGPEFTILCDSNCYADEYITLFTMHYGRGE